MDPKAKCEYYLPVETGNVFWTTQADANKKARDAGAPDDESPEFLGWKPGIVRGIIIDGKPRKIRCNLPVWGRASYDRGIERRWADHHGLDMGDGGL